LLADFIKDMHGASDRPIETNDGRFYKYPSAGPESAQWKPCSCSQIDNP
jgi:hypothetical protein